MLDNGYSNLKIKGLNFYTYNNDINIYYLIKALINIKLNIFNISLLRVRYFEEIIKSLSPKVAIGHDLDKKIFLIKKYFPKIKTIAYQFGYNFSGKLDKKVYERILLNKLLDYYCVFDKRHRKIIKKFVKSNFIITGSVKNNEIPVQNKKKKYDILFISQYRKINKINLDITKLIDFTSSILDKFCKKYNLKLCIALSNNRKDKNPKLMIKKINDEIDFYKKKITSFYYEKNLNSFELADRSNLIVNINSKLGFKLLSKKKKIIFFDISKYFKWDFSRKRNISFTTTDKKNKIIFNKIIKIIKMKDKKWESFLKNNNYHMVYNKNNTILKKTIKNIIKNEI